MQALARLVAIGVLLYPLLLLPTTRPQPREGFFTPVVVVLEMGCGTITLTRWTWYERQSVGVRISNAHLEITP